MTNELEPCPYCGGEAELASCANVVKCTQCGAYGRDYSDRGYSSVLRDDRAVNAWNTRYKRTCEWNIKHSGTLYDVYQCSACGYEYAESRTDHGIKVELCDAKFCPSCGAEVVDGD